jgi:hypothetical protein
MEKSSVNGRMSVETDGGQKNKKNRAKRSEGDREARGIFE